MFHKAGEGAKKKVCKANKEILFNQGTMPNISTA